MISGGKRWRWYSEEAALTGVSFHNSLIVRGQELSVTISGRIAPITAALKGVTPRPPTRYPAGSAMHGYAVGRRGSNGVNSRGTATGAGVSTHARGRSIACPA